MVVEPALAALEHRTDSRIFQEKSTPEILEEVLGAGLGLFGRGIQLSLASSYPVREYTVQYKETDYDFVHRLMEEDGIGYLFDHTGGSEVMVLFDSNAACETAPGSPLRFVERQDAAKSDHGTLPRFAEVAQVRSNAVAGRHFDWTHPSFPVEAKSGGGGAGLPTLERYVHDAPLTFSGFGGTYAEHNAATQAEVYAQRESRDARMAAGGSSNLALRMHHPDAEITMGCATVSIGSRGTTGDVTKGIARCEEMAKGRKSGSTQQSLQNCGVESARQLIRDDLALFTASGQGVIVGVDTHYLRPISGGELLTMAMPLLRRPPRDLERDCSPVSRIGLPDRRIGPHSGLTRPPHFMLPTRRADSRARRHGET